MIDWGVPVCFVRDADGRGSVIVEWRVVDDANVRHIRELEFYANGRIEQTEYAGGKVTSMFEVQIVRKDGDK